MKTFDQILSQFLTNVKIRVKDKTYSSYKGKAKVFSEWLTLHGFSETPLAEINEQTIEQFSIYLANERKLDKSTCQKYFIGLRQVFKYAMVRSEIKELPFNLFVLPQKGKDCSAQVIPRESSKILLEDIRKHDKQLYLACMMEYYSLDRVRN
jgi:site-specific recombinase XerD